jgi:2-hydroxychromene-2-carboxylate isomerase
MSLEVFFDCSSPWTYLGFENVQTFGFEIAWKPILVGGVFNSINPSVYESRSNPVQAKARYLTKDLADWARYCGLNIKFPPTVFPVHSVQAMRGCLVAAEQAKLVDFARAAFQAYWSRDEDISQDDVMRSVCKAAGVDADWLMQAIARPEIKRALRDNTEELIRRGGFGSPTFFVNGDDMYFGNDRMPLIERKLGLS